jgi:hypothetical protein
MCEDPMMSCTVMHHLRPYILLLGLLFVAAVPAQPAVDEALDAQAMSRSFPEGATNGPRGMGAGTGVVGPDEPVLMPNPAQGTTQLLLPEAFRKEAFITLSDATGRMVKQYFLMDDGDGRSFLDLAGMTTGQYFVTVENDKGQRTTVRLNVL